MGQPEDRATQGSDPSAALDAGAGGGLRRRWFWSLTPCESSRSPHSPQVRSADTTITA
jgi:hypothetical protein